MSADSFRPFADLLPEAMLLVAGDGTVLAANRAAAERLGRTATSLAGRHLAELVAEPADAVADYLRACGRSGTLVFGSLTLRGEAETTACRCEGAVLRPREADSPPQILLRLTPKEAAVGRFLALNERIGELTQEIARLHRAEAALHEKSESLRLALEAGRMGTWDWDVPTGAVAWSPTLEALCGLGPGSFEGTFDAFVRRLHPEDRDAVLGHIAAAVERGEEYRLECRLLRPDGSSRWVEGRGRVALDAARRPVRGTGVCMDIDERKRAEQTLRFLADASSALAVLVDPDSTLRKVARLAVPFFADWCAVDLAGEGGALRRLTVAHVDPAKVILVQELAHRYPPDPNADRGAPNVLRTGRSELMEDIPDELLVRGARDDEHLRIVRELGLRSYMCVPLTVRGVVLGVLSFVMAESGRRYGPGDLAVAEDLAHRAAVAVENARLYQELREADRRKDEFLATLAHELRNPLAPVRNGLQVLRLAAGDPAAREQARQMMERQLGHLVRLIDDLMDVSRITRGKIELRKERVELASVVHAALEAGRAAVEAAGHELTVELPARPVYLEADPTRIVQVVGNILNNAARYTPPGGHVWLTADREGDRAVVRVRDDGLGIPRDMLPGVFEMFTQVNHRLERSQGGLGIGLALVRRLVELHGGTVEANSDGPGRGSEFVVRLPLAAEAQGPEARPEADPPGPSAARILVVDDNADAAESLAMLLRLLKNEVFIAPDGPAGIESALRHRPDVVFLDIGLPGLSGYEVARRLRQEPALRDVTIIAVTGWGQPEDRRRSQEAGFDEHLVKPVDPARLDEVLARVPRKNEEA